MTFRTVVSCFSFDGRYFKQINGVAMGTKMGPSYANLFIGLIEELIFEQYSGPKPELFGCNIDDCFGATSCSKPDLESFISYVNSFRKSHDFTWEISGTFVTFLTSRLVSLPIILAPAFITNILILTHIYCIHPRLGDRIRDHLYDIRKNDLSAF